MKKIKRIGALALAICLWATMLPSIPFVTAVGSDYLFMLAEEKEIVTLESIEITSMPRLEYWLGEELDTTGLVLAAFYSDGSIQELEEGFTLSAFNNKKVGQQVITVTYQGKTAEFVVTVSELKVTGIAISSMPRKTEYWTGEALDTTGLAITTFYSDGSVVEVTEGYTVSGYNSAVSGKQTITVSYLNQTASFTVTVKKSEVNSVEIAMTPKKTQYWVGEELDTTGLVLVVYYTDGNMAELTQNFTVSGYDNNTPGVQTLTVSYQGATDTFTVTVSKSEIIGIEVISLPTKTAYWVGEDLDTTGLTLLATYANGTTREITEGYVIPEFSSEMAGQHTVTVWYGEATAEFTVSVKMPFVTGIVIKTQPAKTEYWIGESLDAAGLILTATYSDGSEKVITEGFRLTGFSSLTAGVKTVTVTYQGAVATFTVTVNTPYLTGITVRTQPAKTEYWIGESLDATGLVLTAIYSDGNTKTVTSGYELSGFNSAAAGNVMVTVTYEGMTATFSVTVKTPYVTGIAIKTQPAKTEYWIGESLDATGLTLTATYSDGSAKEIAEGFSLSGFDSSVAGTVRVTVSYENQIATFQVTVKTPYLTGVTIHTLPEKTRYWVGESLDLTGLALAAAYSDGSVKIITEGYTVSGFNSAAAATRTITITYQGMAATFTVTVEKVTQTGIAIATMPIRTEYWVGERLDTTGLTLLVLYSDGSSETVSSGFRTSGFGSATPGAKTVTVTYGGKTVTFTVTVKAVELTGIAIKTQPAKTEYWAGESLSTTGLTLTATYSDGSTAEITGGYTVSGFESNTVGEQTVTVSFQGHTATFTALVKAITLTGIEITSDPVKTEYWAGEELEISGLVVVANYSNGSTAEVTDYTVSGFERNTVGQQTVTVAYNGQSATFGVTVKAVTLTGIAIQTQPAKTEYWAGEELEISGLVVVANYSNGSTAEITDYVISGFESNTVGQQTISVTYNGQTATFSVTVKAIILTGIEIVNQPAKTEYWAGEELEISGLVVIANYSNGSAAEITDYTVSGFDSNVTGLQTVTVSFHGHTAIFTALVKAITLTGIEITSEPVKTEYWAGEELEISGLVVVANYSNGSSAEVTDYTVSGFERNTVGRQTVTVAYNGQSATFGVTVKAVTLTGIAIQTQPAKNQYWVGEALDTAGLVVIAKYSDGSAAEITGYALSGFESAQEGEKTVTVTYETYTAEFSVIVKNAVITGIVIKTQPAKTEYWVGEALDATGLTLTATYSDGSAKEIAEGFTLSGFENETAGAKTVAVTYSGKTATFAVTVKEIVVTGIAIKTQPAKTEYLVGESLDPTGLTLTATYSDGSAKEIAEGFTLSGFESDEYGEKTVTVTYGACTAEFMVQVLLTGECGEELYWMLDGAGQLTILGAGSYIEDYVFAENTEIRSVEILADVTAIGEYAFFDCIELERVTLPESLEQIGLGAFYRTALTQVVIPDSVTELGMGAFAECYALERVTLSGNITAIYEVTFASCASLQSIVIPEGVTYIGAMAFGGCESLETVQIPASVETIGDGVFFGSNNLTDVYYGGYAKQWAQIAIEGNNDPLAAATIHFAENCHHEEVENGACALCGEVIVAVTLDADGNQVGVYTSVADALTAVAAGDTVVLLADSQAETVVLPAGVMLELNGCALTVNSILSFGSSQIVDRSEKNSGVLKITDPEGNMISQDNIHLPVYDSAAGGYRFFLVTVTPKTITGDQKYWFSVEVENFAEFNQLIQSGAEVFVQVKMTWEGQSQPVYAVADLAFTQSWANHCQENAATYIIVTVTENRGVENFVLTPGLTSAGVAVFGEGM